MGDDEAEERLTRQVDQCEIYSIRWATISASVGFTSIRHSSVRQHTSSGWMLSNHFSILIGRRGLTAIGSCGLDLSPCLGLVTLSWTCHPDVGSCTPVRERGVPIPQSRRLSATECLDSSNRAHPCCASHPPPRIAAQRRQILAQPVRAGHAPQPVRAPFRGRQQHLR